MQNVIANAPFGHALTIQNSDIAPIDRNARTALIEGAASR